MPTKRLLNLLPRIPLCKKWRREIFVETLDCLEEKEGAGSTPKVD